MSGAYAAAIALVLLVAEAASACPVCSVNDEAGRVAFLGTTVFLSAMPLVLVFGAGWWLRRRVRAHREAQEGDRPL